MIWFWVVPPTRKLKMPTDTFNDRYFAALPFFICPQLPSMHDVRLISLLGALMSAAYCTIAIVMSATVRPGADVNYSPAAVQRTPIERIMGIFNALTTVFFAYGGHNVALEIQATIPVGGKHPASSVPAMMRGVNITFIVTGMCFVRTLPADVSNDFHAVRQFAIVPHSCKVSFQVLVTSSACRRLGPSPSACQHAVLCTLVRQCNCCRCCCCRSVLLWGVNPGLLGVRHCCW